ncbi:MAG: hypothetical protein D6815_10430 [Candidatus Dadabacteria bacterium]|nr:MAG: hypothetical protein D6815_10430 [Candidatus Dadabacteria bacterium]
MIQRSPRVRRLAAALTLVVGLGIAGCQHETEWEPLADQKIYVSDKFFDVAVRSPKEAFVIGYGGKIIHTTDGGFTWEQIPSGTDEALYSIDFAPDNPQVGWIVGQQGLVLKTTDGGRTWVRQKAEPWLDEECADPEERRLRPEDKPCQLAYLFAVSVIDQNNAVAVGDKSLYIRTRDGGQTWTIEKVKDPKEATGPGSEWMIVMEDPIFYDVQFLDASNGYIVGEFGTIFHTTDGGKTWENQKETLMDETIFDVLDLPTLFDVEFADPMHGIAVGLDGRIALTDDGGKDWNFVPSNVEEYVDPFYTATILPNGVRWVGGASGQVVRADPGKPFEKGDLGSAVNNWIRRIRFYDNEHGWLVGGFGLIMYTEDGGKTWYRRIG